VQLGFTHRALKTEQQAVVEQRWVIDAIVIADERIGDAAQFQQAIPIGIVSRQAGDFQSEHDAYMGQCDFTGEAGKPGGFVG
jgi:hypothetical protein